MNKFKKILSIFILTAMLVGFAGCAETDGGLQHIPPLGELEKEEGGLNPDRIPEPDLPITGGTTSTPTLPGTLTPDTVLIVDSIITESPALNGMIARSSTLKSVLVRKIVSLTGISVVIEKTRFCSPAR